MLQESAKRGEDVCFPNLGSQKERTSNRLRLEEIPAVFESQEFIHESNLNYKPRQKFVMRG